MTYSQRTRDGYRLAVAAVTGITAAGALTAGGWLAGVAAQTTEGDGGAVPQPATPPPADTAEAAAPARTKLKPRVVVRERPQETRVTTRYVTPSGGTAVGGGGTVTAQTSPGSSHSQPAGHAPAPAPAPQPAPAPAPAPSSGS